MSRDLINASPGVLPIKTISGELSAAEHEAERNIHTIIRSACMQYDFIAFILWMYWNYIVMILIVQGSS
ncbi:hypothetical protein FEDK69T_04000 [Flavobacterium enshiense DK69]|nr:hypothetical protein FEDK69T_04000 [Flavobacterium enshiense DK69]